MQHHELTAWLGDGHGLSEEQVASLLATAQDIETRYPNEDDADDREVSMLITYRLLVEDPAVALGEQATKLARARRAEHQALVAIRQAALCLVEPGDTGARGIASARGFSRAAGVDRQAVLSWLGRR